MVVLDVIHRIQADQANDLACRWNCKAGKCVSCSVEINGKPRLACMTRMNELEEDSRNDVLHITKWTSIFSHRQGRRSQIVRLREDQPFRFDL